VNKLFTEDCSSFYRTRCVCWYIIYQQRVCLYIS